MINKLYLSNYIKYREGFAKHADWVGMCNGWDAFGNKRNIRAFGRSAKREILCVTYDVPALDQVAEFVEAIKDEPHGPALLVALFYVHDSQQVVEIYEELCPELLAEIGEIIAASYDDLRCLTFSTGGYCTCKDWQR